jgi:hypothetical protein
MITVGSPAILAATSQATVYIAEDFNPLNA